jgi:hypothetical protein
MQKNKIQWNRKEVPEVDSHKYRIQFYDKGGKAV